MLKWLGNLIGAGVFLLLTAGLVALAKWLPGLWFSFYPQVSRTILRYLGIAFGWCPWALWEILLALLVLGAVIWLIWAVSKKKFLSWLSGLVMIGSILVFLYVGIWGLNYFDRPLDEKLGMEVRDYTQAELEEAARYYTAQAGLWADRVARDGEGDLIPPDFAQLSTLAVGGCTARPEELFHDPAPRVKRLILPEAFNWMGIAGIFVDLTGEAGVNEDTFAASLPFTMCHELTHSLGVASEDQANFGAFLICVDHQDPLFVYSGYYDGFIYLYNALYDQDPGAAQKLWDYASDSLMRDCGRAREHYEQYDGKVQEAAEQVNDAYLKTFDQEAGVESYDLVTRDLIAYYFSYVKQ